MKKHVFIGVISGLLLLGVYIGILTLAQGLSHALDQVVKGWYWVGLLVVGFGSQAGLFSFIRKGLRQRQATTTASVATSGGVSAGSMLACCAHHLADVLPLIGLAGLATFLTSYQVIFIIVGILSNAVGITIMLEVIQRHQLCPWVAGWKWDMNRVKRWVTVSSIAILVTMVSLTAFVPDIGRVR